MIFKPVEINMYAGKNSILVDKVINKLISVDIGTLKIRNMLIIIIITINYNGGGTSVVGFLFIYLNISIISLQNY